MKTKRWSEIDDLYTIGTILVVLGHSHSSDWSTFNGTFLPTFINFIYHFHMPLFFFIAGFLFLNSESIYKEGYREWIYRKILKILTPYIFLSIISAFPKYYVEHGVIDGKIIYDFLKIIVVPREGIWGHFWFLPVLLLLYIIMGGIYRLFADRKGNYVLLLACTIAVVFYYLPIETQWFGINDLKEYTIFFVVGMLVYRLLKQREFIVPIGVRVIMGVLGIIVTLWATVNNYTYRTLSLILALIMIMVCWQGAKMIGENKLCKWMSKHNFTIYIYSWPFQAIVMAVAGRLELSWWIVSMTMFVVGMVMPVAMVIIYDKFKVINNRFLDLVLGVK